MRDCITMNTPDREQTDQFSLRVISDTPPQDWGIAQSKVTHHRASRVSFSMLLMDIALMTGVYILVVVLRDGAALWAHFDRATLIIMTCAMTMAVASVGGYGRHLYEMTSRYVFEHLIGAVLAFLGVITVVYFLFPEEFRASRTSVLLTMALTPFITLGVRNLTFRARRHIHDSRSLIVIGDKGSRDTFDKWLKTANSGYETYYMDSQSGVIFSANTNKRDLNGLTIEQAISTLGQDLEAIIVNDNLSNLAVKFQNLLVALNFNVIPVYTLETFYAREWQVVPLDTLSASWALNGGFNLSQSVTYSRLKRLYDICISSLALFILCPLFAVVAIAIKSTSKGPVFFRQVRVGQNERKFMIYKFRTMRTGSENGARYTSEGDSRITPIGAFLRKSRLDELPQLINVLKNEMSIIGPRAEWDVLVRDYEKNIPYYHMRHLVKPGITGWAQVNYSYGANIEDTKNKLRYDLYYVRFFSFMLDFTIMAKTVYVMLFGKGR